MASCDGLVLSAGQAPLVGAFILSPRPPIVAHCYTGSFVWRRRPSDSALISRLFCWRPLSPVLDWPLYLGGRREGCYVAEDKSVRDLRHAAKMLWWTVHYWLISWLFVFLVFSERLMFFMIVFLFCIEFVTIKRICWVAQELIITSQNKIVEINKSSSAQLKKKIEFFSRPFSHSLANNKSLFV